MVIQELLRHLVERAGSDLHLKVGAVPYVRIDGELVPAPFPELAEVDTERFAFELMSDRQVRYAHQRQWGKSYSVRPGKIRSQSQPRPP